MIVTYRAPIRGSGAPTAVFCSLFLFVAAAMIWSGVARDSTTDLPVSPWFGALVCFLALAALVWSAFLAVRIKSFIVEPSRLKVSTKFLGRVWNRTFDLSEVSSLEQVKVTGNQPNEGEAWNLAILAKDPIRLIAMGHYEPTLWLGTVLSEALSVPFHEGAPPRNMRIGDLNYSEE